MLFLLALCRCVCVVLDQCGNWRSVLWRVHCLIGQMALCVSLSDAVAFKQNIHTHTDTTTPFLSHLHTRNYHFPFCLPHQPLAYLPEINLHLFKWKDAWRVVVERVSLSTLEVPSRLETYILLANICGFHWRSVGFFTLYLQNIKFK